MRMRRFGRALAVGVAALVGLTACGMAGAGTESVLDKQRLVIGVKPDQPGLGLRTQSGGFQGFDVDVAKYIAHRLGVADENVTFRATTSADREKFLRQGVVDLVIATYSITPKRKTQVTFAGPYYVAHQDILVRADDTRIRNVRDLAGMRLCRAAGSNSFDRVVVEKGIKAQPVPAASYGECVTKLRDGEVDAVSTDDLILAGFVGAQGKGLKIVNAPFTDEKYGIGLRKGDIDGCEAVNKAITQMYQDGTAQALLKKWFASSGLAFTTTVPEFEGCA